MKTLVVASLISVMAAAGGATLLVVSDEQEKVSDEQEKEGVDPISITCQFYWRERNYLKHDPVTKRELPIESHKKQLSFELSATGDAAPETLTAEFPGTKIEAILAGGDLTIEAINLHTGRPMAKSTFPISDKLPTTRNHGFTGLSYIHNPDDESELQFWCVRK